MNTDRSGLPSGVMGRPGAGRPLQTRSGSIATAFPDSTSRGATVVVPGILFVLFGLAGTGAVHAALDVDWPLAATISLAIGASAGTGAVRWVTGRPPDYTRPMVSTPAGGVPTNLYGSAFRGFDILLLTTAPLLFLPTSTGVLLSLGISYGVVRYLTSRA